MGDHVKKSNRRDDRNDAIRHEPVRVRGTRKRVVRVAHPWMHGDDDDDEYVRARVRLLVKH